jgi:hypothetical protein
MCPAWNLIFLFESFPEVMDDKVGIRGDNIKWFIPYSSGSQTVRRGALGRREIFRCFHWNDT